jgi:hypothetical protein
MNSNGPRQFGYAQIGRFGLGHALMAWARCVVWCDETGAQMLAPRWFQWRLGPYLRNERDKREYFRLFSNAGYISGLEKFYWMATCRRVSPDRSASLRSKTDRATLVVFKNETSNNLPKYFDEIRGKSHLIDKELRRITKPIFLPEPQAIPHIAVHVRLGDFTRNLSRQALLSGRNNACLPIEWYRDILCSLRARVGSDLPAFLYSDGSDEELALLLDLPCVTRPPAAHSITDMLSIARASVLISSASGFSIWGSFLGQVPRISFPNQRKVRVVESNGLVDFEPECERGDDIPESFVDATNRRVTQTTVSSS